MVILETQVLLFVGDTTESTLVIVLGPYIFILMLNFYYAQWSMLSVDICSVCVFHLKKMFDNPFLLLDSWQFGFEDGSRGSRGLEWG